MAMQATAQGFSDPSDMLRPYNAAPKTVAALQAQNQQLQALHEALMALCPADRYSQAEQRQAVEFVVFEAVGKPQATKFDMAPAMAAHIRALHKQFPRSLFETYHDAMAKSDIAADIWENKLKAARPARNDTRYYQVPMRLPTDVNRWGYPAADSAPVGDNGRAWGDNADVADFMFARAWAFNKLQNGQALILASRLGQKDQADIQKFINDTFSFDKRMQTALQLATIVDVSNAHNGRGMKLAGAMAAVAAVAAGAYGYYHYASTAAPADPLQPTPDRVFGPADAAETPPTLPVAPPVTVTEEACPPMPVASTAMTDYLSPARIVRTSVERPFAGMLKPVEGSAQFDFSCSAPRMVKTISIPRDPRLNADPLYNWLQGGDATPTLGAGVNALQVPVKLVFDAQDTAMRIGKVMSAHRNFQGLSAARKAAALKEQGLAETTQVTVVVEQRMVKLVARTDVLVGAVQTRSVSFGNGETRFELDVVGSNPNARPSGPRP